jgi:hypothetical protein
MVGGTLDAMVFLIGRLIISSGNSNSNSTSASNPTTISSQLAARVFPAVLVGRAETQSHSLQEEHEERE